MDQHSPTRQGERSFTSQQRFVTVDQLFEGTHDRMKRDMKPNLNWIHLPANNMRWVELLLHEMDRERQARHGSKVEFRNEILKPNMWIERRQRGSKRSQISFMRSTYENFHLDKSVPEGKQNQAKNQPAIKETHHATHSTDLKRSCSELNITEQGIVLFMPFIHWETRSRCIELESVLFLNHVRDLLTLSGGEDVLRDLSTEISSIIRSNFNAFCTPYGLLTGGMVFIRTLDEMRVEENWPRYPEKISPEFRKSLFDICNQVLESGRDEHIELIATDANASHPLHIRRTLDQSYYFTLENTRLRDSDQVVTRYCREELCRQVPVVVMVDQLWLWVVDDTIITCFPKRQSNAREAFDPDPHDYTDVLQSILQNVDQVKGSDQLVNLIINECTGICFDGTKFLPEDFQFLDIFANSINKIADKEADRYRFFIDILKYSDGLADSSILKDTQLLRGISILKESQLLRETKDIIDELNIIVKIIDAQKEALKPLVRGQGPSSDGPIPGAEALQCCYKYYSKVDNLRQQAWALNKSINDLTDLQQKHANLSEARSARIQADATGKQGNTILVFTIVTILFLPPSFMASFFALSISSFQTDDKGDLHLSYVLKYMLIFSFTIFAIFGTLAFTINGVATLFGKLKSKFFLTKGTETEVAMKEVKKKGPIDDESERAFVLPRVWSVGNEHFFRRHPNRWPGDQGANGGTMFQRNIPPLGSRSVESDVESGMPELFET